MYARIADVAFEHLGVTDRIPQHGVARLLGGFQLGHIVDGVLQVELFVRNLVGNQFAEPIRLREQEFLHTRNVLDGQFGGHRAVGDDVCDLLLAVFLRHPVQHASTAVVVEIHVDIGERDTVGVQETLEQQVVGDRVDLRDSEAVGHGRSGGRTTSRTHRNVQFLTRRPDKVLHDQEVTRETHRLHDVQLEPQPLLLLLGQLLAVTPVGAFERQFGQIIRLELDAVELVVAAQAVDFLVGSLLRHHHVAVLVAREFVEQVLLREPGAVLLLGAELLGNLELGHDRRMVDRVALDLTADIHRRRHRLGIGLAENRGHLGRRLQPLLLGVEHALGVVEVLARRETDQTVVRLGVVLVHEMHVVRADHPHVVFRGQFAQVLVHVQLHGVGLVVGPLDRCFMQLQFEVIVVPEDLLVPLYRLFGPLEVVRRDGTRHLAGQTGRTADQPLVIFLQLHAVRSRTHVETLGPRLRDDLYQVVVSLEVLGQQDQVVAALVGLALLVVQAAACHIDLAADNGLEGQFAAKLLQLFLTLGDLRGGVGLRAVAEGGDPGLAFGDFAFEFSLDLLNVIVKLLDTEHIAMVCHGDAGLSVGHGLVHEFLDAGLSVENRILGMYVKMYELRHSCVTIIIKPSGLNLSGHKDKQKTGGSKTGPDAIRGNTPTRYDTKGSHFSGNFYGKALAFYQQNA